MIWLGYVLTYAYLLLILLIANVLNEKFKINKFITRKIVHIGVSFCFLIMYYYFQYTFHMFIPPLTFIILNYLSYKKNIFKGMEDENSFGTICYPISVFIMSLLTYFNNDLVGAYAIGLFCMGLGDGLAPIIARNFESKKIINKKTLVGTITVLVVSLFVVFFFNSFFNLDLNIFEIIIIGISASLIELIGIKGLDNVYLPLGIFIIVWLLEVV